MYTPNTYAYTPKLLGVHLGLELDFDQSHHWILRTSAHRNEAITNFLLFTYSNSINMELQPPPEGLESFSHDDLIKQVQEHAGPQGYAVTKKRTKMNKKNTHMTGSNSKTSTFIDAHSCYQQQHMISLIDALIEAIYDLISYPFE